MIRVGTLACCLMAAMAFVSPASADDVVGDPYTLNVCAVTGEALGTGDVEIYVHEGRQIRFCCGGCEPQFKADPAKFIAKVDEQIVEQQLAHYPLETCVVSGKTLDASAKTVVVNNRAMKLCCANCPKAVAADPAKFIAKIDEAVIAQQSDAYALDTCVVSGKKLGSMGEPISKVVGNRLIKLCCAGCEGQVDKVPAKYLAALDGKEIEEGSSSK